MSSAQAVRFAAVLVVLAGYAFVFRSGEATLAAQLEDNTRRADAVRAAEATLAAAASVQAERVRLRGALQAAASEHGAAPLVARFVRDAAATARAQRTAITAIVSSGDRVRGVAPQDASAGIALDVTLEGRYADVLATLRALPAAHVPAAIALRTLARKNAGAPDPAVNATIHAVLESEPGTPTTAEADAGARPR